MFIKLCPKACDPHLGDLFDTVALDSVLVIDSFFSKSARDIYMREESNMAKGSPWIN